MTDDPKHTDNVVNTALDRGAALIRRYAGTLPETPGVYRMLNKAGDVLYVGKARALKRRVGSYANVDKLPLRLKRMVADTHDMVFVHTHTEVEALLLESNLIKTLKPRYNVLLRDDKSFPYIMVTGDHDYPLMTKHRGPRTRPGEYFGPFASATAVNETISTLQRAFMLRNCSDHIFSVRTRPCLQYHIKRCTAPCVGFVSKEDYTAQVEDARSFLSGKSQEVQDRMAAKMQETSEAEDFETAALYRDRIKALTSIQSRQDINIQNLGDADVVGLWRENGRSCIQVFFFRGGQNFGNRAYFPRHADDDDTAAIMAAFLAQFYENKPIPPIILLSNPALESELLTEALTARAQRPGQITLAVPSRGDKKRLINFAVRNARESLEREALQLAGESILLKGVAATFNLEDPPERIEVYDNSHISGAMMVGAMIVAGPGGFQKNAYRKFNIREANAADDYGMMREVMRRRFKSAGDDAAWPDLILIDGGQGQLNVVQEVLTDLGIADRLTVVSIAKGPDRNAGRETFFMPGRPSFQMPPQDPVLHYLQRLRDEAHRFVIGTHRARRSRAIEESPLDAIPGIGAKRKKALLVHFGSARAVADAGIRDLEMVDGISAAVAKVIYGHFHES